MIVTATLMAAQCPQTGHAGARTARTTSTRSWVQLPDEQCARRIGRCTLEKLDERVARRRDNSRFYQRELTGLPCLEFMRSRQWAGPLAGSRCSHLTGRCRPRCEHVRTALARTDRVTPVVEADASAAGARPPPAYLSGVAEPLVRRGLCMPSGSALTSDQLSELRLTMRALGSARRRSL